MPAARTFSPSFNKILGPVNAALENPDGFTIYFRISKYGSMEACAAASRSFQVTFCSLRSRARRRSMKAKGELHARDSDAMGIYDALHCERNRLPDNSGWFVWLGPAAAAANDLEVVDNRTGELWDPGDEKRKEARVMALMPFVMKRTLTAEMWDELEAVTPNWTKAMGVNYPRPGSAPSQEFDLADDDLASDDEEGG